MRTTRFIAALLFAVPALSAFGGPPRDQGFWTFFKEGIKDDLTLIGLGVHAGVRVFVPGYSMVEDLVTDTATDSTVPNGVYDISTFATEHFVDIVKNTENPLYRKANRIMARIDRIPKRGHPLSEKVHFRYMTPRAKNLFKIAKVVNWIGTAIDSVVELTEAKKQADAYLAAREKEYERMRREKAEKDRAEEPDEEKHPCFPCWFGDLYGTCSDPDCPNYGNPHSKYKGGGTPSPRKRKKKNNGKASAP